MENVWTSLIESAFTFLGVLASAYFASHRATKKQAEKQEKKQKKMEAQLDQLCAHDHDQYLSILRLTVMNPEMPISERIIAGDKYVKEGGNGDVKKYYLKMVAEHTK